MTTIVNIPTLSHECRDPEAHCLTLPWKDEHYWVCARCTGMGLGFTSSIFLLLIPWSVTPMLCVFGMLDWLICHFTGWRGHRFIRLCSGWLLGHLWFQIVSSVFLFTYKPGTLPAFLCLIGILLFRKWTKNKNTQERHSSHFNQRKRHE